MTLVEILVVIAVAGILAGVVYGIFDTTVRDARQLEETDAVFGEAQIVYKALSERFQQQAVAVAGGAKGAWEPDRCVLPVMNAKTAPGVWTCAISDTTTEAVQKGFHCIAMRLSPPPGAKEAKAQAQWLGASPREYSHAIAFQYAARFNGVEPVWEDRVPDGAAPRLVKAGISIASRKLPKIKYEVVGIFEI